MNSDTSFVRSFVRSPSPSAAGNGSGRHARSEEGAEERAVAVADHTNRTMKCDERGGREEGRGEEEKRADLEWNEIQTREGGQGGREREGRERAAIVP